MPKLGFRVAKKFCRIYMRYGKKQGTRGIRDF